MLSCILAGLMSLVSCWNYDACIVVVDRFGSSFIAIGVLEFGVDFVSS